MAALGRYRLCAPGHTCRHEPAAPKAERCACGGDARAGGAVVEGYGILRDRMWARKASADLARRGAAWRVALPEGGALEDTFRLEALTILRDQAHELPCRLRLTQVLADVTAAA